jgi:hypothetical protein
MLRPIAVVLNVVLLIVVLVLMSQGRMGTAKDAGELALDILFVSAPAAALIEILRSRRPRATRNTTGATR